MDDNDPIPEDKLDVVVKEISARAAAFAVGVPYEEKLTPELLQPLLRVQGDEPKHILTDAATAFSDEEKNEFIEFVREGGEVPETMLDRNVRGAKCLVFLRSSTTLIGVAALKNPQTSYREKLTSWAGTAIPASSLPYELGYIYIKKSHQGRKLSRRLVEAALAWADGQGVYATSRKNNEAMHKILKRYGFERAGTPYESRGQNIQLFIRREYSATDEKTEPA